MTGFSSLSGVVSTSSFHKPNSAGDHKFLSAPACLVPAVAAAAAAAFDSEYGGGGESGTNPENIASTTDDVGGVRLAETRSVDEERPSSASSQRDLQEQELRKLLAAASISPRASAPPPPPPSESTTLPEDDARTTTSGAAARQQPGEASRPDSSAVADCAPVGVGCEAAAASRSASASASAVSGSHPVLEMYRSVGEPLDPMSFEELKRRVGDAVERDDAGPASVSELVDFLGVLKLFSKNQLERLNMSANRGTAGRPSNPPAAREGHAARAEQEEAAVCDEMEGRGCEEMEDVCDEMEGAGCGGGDRCCDAAAGPPAGAAPAAPGSLSEIILKFTTVADGNQASSFAVRREEGATVGRGACNDISIPNDSCMGESDHARIVWRGGAFHVEDHGHPYGASVRIGTGRGLRDWPLNEGSVFSAGNSVFHTTEIDEERGMLLEIVAGPLKGERRRVRRDGATVGRATESTISIADRELSRNHSTIECEDNRSLSVSGSSSGCGGSSRAMEADDELDDSAEAVALRDTTPRDSLLAVDGQSGSGEDEEASQRGEVAGRLEYFLCDVGSTNGTYVQLVGPYASSRRLELSDQILIGRTGFSINRFDWGVWEDRGARRTMEDKSVVIQDMAVASLTSLGLGPQTFLAVYDGHGGGEASAFLWQRLHVAVAEALEDATPRVAAALQRDRASERLAVFGSGGGAQALRCDDGGGKNPSSSNRGTGGGGGGGAGGWPSAAAVFSSSSGAGVGARIPQLPPALPAPTSTSPPRPALAMTAMLPREGGSADDSPPPRRGREPGVKSDEPRSAQAGGGGGKGLWWGCEAASAAGGARSGGCSPIEGPRSLSAAPSLPAEWLNEAREIAKAAGKGTTTGGGGGGGGESPSSDDCGFAAADAEGGGFPAAAGGDAASGVCTEKDGGGGGGGQAAAEDGARQMHDGDGDGWEEASRDFGVGASPPPAAESGSGSPSGGGAQSPGGGPSRPLATAGLPAEGGGGGVAHEGGAGYDRQKAPSAVDRVIEEVVSRAFLATDDEFLSTANKPSSGSTATTAMVLGDRFYSFNVGDSRTILCRAGRAEVISKDHKPSREDETERIKRAGGMVIHKRVMGELAVSRAFGDRAFKIGIKAILREEDEHQQRLAHENQLENLNDDDNDDDKDEDDGLNHAPAAPPTAAHGGGNELSSLEASTADRNSLTMGRGSSGKLLPPPPPAPAAAPPAPPAAAPPSAPCAAPPAPPTADAARKGRRAINIKPVTDPAEALITAEPEMLTCRITPEDEFILLACDGLFDVFTSDEVVKIVRKELSRHGDTQRVCETLTRKAIDERYTQDNVSVVLVVLKKFW